MDYGEGLALYEHHEADLRPDLFLPRGTDPAEGTSQRLRTNGYYIALRYDKDQPREIGQHIMYKVENPKTGQWVSCSLVDFGPRQSTGRICDVSPGVMQSLRMQTDDIANIERLY